MSKGRLDPILRALVGVDTKYHGVIGDIINRFNSPDAPAWDATFKQSLKNGVSAQSVTLLLEFETDVSIPAIIGFSAVNAFRVGETLDGIKVGWLGERFKKLFLKKTETATPAAELRQHVLKKPARDPAIITELGGEAKVEITLGQFWNYLTTADRTLWHVAYIRDDESVLWAVYAYWRSGGLSVEALPLDHPLDWDVGYRFLSR